MKLDYLPDVTDNGRFPQADPDKLIRLYDFNAAEVIKLIELVNIQVIANGASLPLSSVSFIECINCHLTFVISPTNEGIVLPPNKTDFICALSLDYFQQMVDCMEPFSDDNRTSGNHNWLYDPGPDNIDLLFSPGPHGGW